MHWWWLRAAAGGEPRGWGDERAAESIMLPCGLADPSTNCTCAAGCRQRMLHRRGRQHSAPIQNPHLRHQQLALGVGGGRRGAQVAALPFVGGGEAGPGAAPHDAVVQQLALVGRKWSKETSLRLAAISNKHIGLAGCTTYELPTTP